jgi:hypothetical protein
MAGPAAAYIRRQLDHVVGAGGDRRGPRPLALMPQLAFDEWPPPHILAIQLEQIEAAEDLLPRRSIRSEARQSQTHRRDRREEPESKLSPLDAGVIRTTADLESAEAAIGARTSDVVQDNFDLGDESRAPSEWRTGSDNFPRHLYPRRRPPK